MHIALLLIIFSQRYLCLRVSMFRSRVSLHCFPLIFSQQCDCCVGRIVVSKLEAFGALGSGALVLEPYISSQSRTWEEIL